MIGAEFKVTQGGADTAAQASIATMIQPGVSMVGWKLRELLVCLSPDLVKTWGSGGVIDLDLTIQVTKRSLASSIARITDYGDDDLIMTFDLAGIALGTPGNMLIQQCSFKLPFPDDYILYAPYLYIQLITAGTSAANIVWGQVRYDTVKLSQKEAFQAIASGAC